MSLLMKTIIDIVLLVIIALCTWSGYKKGLIGAAASFLAVIVALYAGCLLSSAYSGEVIPALKPFIAGYVDSAENRRTIMDNMGFSNDERSLTDILNEDSSLRYDYAYECMGIVGFSENNADKLAAEAVAVSNEQGVSVTNAVVQVLCNTVTYVGGTAIAFLMIIILITAVANIGNLSFRLPNMENLDEIGGAVMGFVKGFLYCILFSWLLSFLGLAIGKHTMNDTVLARFFLAFEFVTNSIM